MITGVLKLMEGMQEIQKRLVKGTGGEGPGESEVVRHLSDLPKLSEWSQESAPIDFNDWLLLVTPQMSDLSQSSETWWKATVECARQWYENHMKLSPIERLSHSPKPTKEMAQERWTRLERRASSMLMSAIPEQLREEIESNKAMMTLGILAKAMQLYQSGGLSEKSAILAALESPGEAPNVHTAITTLRKWVRWRRRAEEVGVSIPDATIVDCPG